MTREFTKFWDLVVLGGINTDFVVVSDRLPEPGQSVAGTSFYSGPGGKGANQAVAGARLGARVALIGCVGRDERGRDLVRGLRRNRVNVQQVRADSALPTGAAIIGVDQSGEKQISVAFGANESLRIRDIDSAEDTIAAAKVLLMQLEVPLPAVLRAASIAKKHGTTVILDPAPPRELPEKLFGLVDVIRPNRDEAEQLTGRKIRTCEEARAAAGVFMGWGTRVVVMEAGEGNLVMSEGEDVFIPHFQVKAVDATGAGDAFAAAFAVGVSEGRPFAEAGRFASATAALATTKIGAQEALPKRAQVQRLLEARNRFLV